MDMGKHGIKVTLVLAILLIVACSRPSVSDTIYVKWDSPNNGPGNDWAHAFHAVTAALITAEYNDEIWVAGDSVHPYLERITVKRGVGVYGGFAGTETTRDQRDWNTNVTILDGNRAGDVVYFSSSGASATTVLDGFTVRNGGGYPSAGIHCNGTPSITNNTISGNSCYGIYCSGDSSPSITNNTISGNTRNGIECRYRSSPSVTNNTISANERGIFCDDSSPLIAHNTISGNTLEGVYFDGLSASITNNTISGNNRGVYCHEDSSPSITGNTIRGNANSGIYCYYSSPSIMNNAVSDSIYGIYCNGDALPLIASNTISGNYTGIYCGASSITNNTVSFNTIGIYYGGFSSPSITNNIVAFNAIGVNSYGLSYAVLNNNCVYNPGTVNYSGLSAGDGDISVDPKLVSAAYGRLHIQPDSPCVGKGLDSVVQPSWTDVDGQSRIQGLHVDIGADESDGTLWPEYQPVVVRVSPSGSDDALHDGSSWALAKRTVQGGIDAASATGGEVWIAAGTYAEHVVLRSYVYVYGGFAGVESVRGARNWVANKCILDGSGTGTVVSAWYNCVSALDGFTVRNSGSGYDGDAISCLYSSPSIVNCTISDNPNNGIVCSNSSPLIMNNIISGNGNGIRCGWEASPSITNNTILGNTNCGIFTDYHCYPSISNNIVAFNSTGIHKNNTIDDAPVLKNNCVHNPGGVNYFGLSAGAGDFSLDPMFVSRETGDCHLQLSSPCINAGLSSAVQPGSLDMDGEPRILPAGGTVDIGADEYGVHPVYSVGEAKALAADGQEVYLAGRWRGITTAKFGDLQAYYVEHPNRSSGIRCSGTSLLDPGQTGVIRGIMGTGDGERVLTQASVVDGSLSHAPIPSALAMNNKAVGGGSFGLQAGVSGGLGLNNIGLLVRLYGKAVTAESIADTYWLDDGSSLYVKCLMPGIETVDTSWQYLSATGVSSIRTFRDDFLVLDQEAWPIRSGNAAVSDGWLVLQSTGATNGGAQVQSKEHFLYQPLEFRAEVSNWENDTSLGLERWGSGFHYAIVVTEGVLGIIRETDPPDPEHKEVYLPIPGWAGIKGQANTFKITWKPGYVALDIVDHPECSVSYSGGLVPDKPLLVRFNASNDHADTVRVDYVAGAAERLLRVRNKSEVTAH